MQRELPLKHAHASCIVETPKGDLLVCWFRNSVSLCDLLFTHFFLSGCLHAHGGGALGAGGEGFGAME